MVINKLTLKTLGAFEAATGMKFKDKALLAASLTHRSYLAEGKKHDGYDNQRLEWLGDSILGLVVTEYLFALLPQSDEGALSKFKSQLVSKDALARFARHLDIGKYLFIGKGEEETGGRKRDSILSDAVEALIGAIYLDGGLPRARRFILKYHKKEIERTILTKHIGDHKSMLQELMQKKGAEAPVYHLVASSGPDHKKVFTVGVFVKGLEYRGTGYSKKEAEQMAAWVALDAFKG